MPAGTPRVEHVNPLLRSLGARLPLSAAPAVLGAIDDPTERRAEIAVDSIPTRIRRSISAVEPLQERDGQRCGRDATDRMTQPVLAPTGTRIRRSAAVDRFADMIDADAFTVGRDIFMTSTAGDDTLAHELSHVADNESTTRPVIRRRVRSTLRLGSNRFGKFKTSTESASTLYVKVADDMYNEYRPWEDAPPDTVMADPTIDGVADPTLAPTAEPMELDAKPQFEKSDDPDAAKRRVKLVGDARTAKKASYSRRAKRLSNWATGAVTASEFLFNELAVAHRFAKDAATTGAITSGPGISPLAHIHPGDSNTAEADMNVKLSTVPAVGGTTDDYIAIEVKTPVSTLHTTIAANLKKAAMQLAKRQDFNGGAVTKYVAIIDIVNKSDFLGEQSGKDPATEIKGRAEKAAQQAAGQIARDLLKARKKVAGTPDSPPVPPIEWIVRVNGTGGRAEYRHTTAQRMTTDTSKVGRLAGTRQKKKAGAAATDSGATGTPDVGAVAPVTATAPTVVGGVRSTLRGGHQDFTKFVDRVDQVNGMYNEVASALYDAYRPWMDRPAAAAEPDKVAPVKADRAKTVGTDAVAPFEVSRNETQIRQKKVVEKAQRFAAQADRFAHWAERAANASEYLYSELSSTVDFVLDPTQINPLNPQPDATPAVEQRVTRGRAKSQVAVPRAAPTLANIDAAEASKRRAAIHPGGDTKGEADMTVVRGAQTIAVEIKAPVTDTASAIDAHISKAIKQLSKRTKFDPGDGAKKVTSRVAVIDIRQPTNDFPYTPTTQDDRANPTAKARERINGLIVDVSGPKGVWVPEITWVIKSVRHPNIQSFKTDPHGEQDAQPDKKRKREDPKGPNKKPRR